MSSTYGSTNVISYGWPFGPAISVINYGWPFGPAISVMNPNILIVRTHFFFNLKYNYGRSFGPAIRVMNYGWPEGYG